MLVWILGGVIVLGIFLTMLDVRVISKLKGELRFAEAALRGAKVNKEKLEHSIYFLECQNRLAALDNNSIKEHRDSLLKLNDVLRRENDELLDMFIRQVAKTANKDSSSSKHKPTSKKNK